MLSLDRSKNDSSVTLDFLRATAAQIVCIGHAFNNSGTGIWYTQLPTVGVLFFFVISGFVIAHVLATRSERPSYRIVEFSIERFARIYTPYLPAILLITATELAMRYSGYSLKGDAHDGWTLFGSILMRQNMPLWPYVSTYGTAEQLTSVALEFHIYFFVGGIFFVLARRDIILSAFVAVLFASAPLAYFQNITGSDHALFVIWLIGFGACFVASAIKIDGRLAALAMVAFIVCSLEWALNRTPNDYDLSNYPMLGLAFFSLVILTQRTKIIPEKAAKIITAFANCSYSLFLIHLTVIRVLFTLKPPSGIVDILLAIVAANIIAFCFYFAFERHYRLIAEKCKDILIPKRV